MGLISGEGPSCAKPWLPWFSSGLPHGQKDQQHHRAPAPPEPGFAAELPRAAAHQPGPSPPGGVDMNSPTISGDLW